MLNALEYYGDANNIPEFLDEANDESVALDCQLYDQPPPSYKQAKLYPKINDAKGIVDDEINSHIYENINELSTAREKNQSRDITRKSASHHLSVDTNNNTNISVK